MSESVNYVVLSVNVVQKFNLAKYEILESLFRKKNLNIDEKFFTDILEISKIYTHIEEKFSFIYADHLLTMVKLSLTNSCLNETLIPTFNELTKKLFDHVASLTLNLIKLNSSVEE